MKNYFLFKTIEVKTKKNYFFKKRNLNPYKLMLKKKNLGLMFNTRYAPFKKTNKLKKQTTQEIDLVKRAMLITVGIAPLALAIHFFFDTLLNKKFYISATKVIQCDVFDPKKKIFMVMVTLEEQINDIKAITKKIKTSEYGICLEEKHFMTLYNEVYCTDQFEDLGDPISRLQRSVHLARLHKVMNEKLEANKKIYNTKFIDPLKDILPPSPFPNGIPTFARQIIDITIYHAGHYSKTTKKKAPIPVMVNGKFRLIRSPAVDTLRDTEINTKHHPTVEKALEIKNNFLRFFTGKTYDSKKNEKLTPSDLGYIPKDVPIWSANYKLVQFQKKIGVYSRTLINIFLILPFFYKNPDEKAEFERERQKITAEFRQGKRIHMYKPKPCEDPEISKWVKKKGKTFTKEQAYSDDLAFFDHLVNKYKNSIKDKDEDEDEDLDEAYFNYQEEEDDDNYFS